LDLKKALLAQTVPKKTERVSTLPFTFVSFGDRQSHATGGGFTSSPPGHWQSIKIFISEKDDEGQVFININPLMKLGQFSIKDQDYGDIVLAKLASVL
jgi:hypothetical protein